MMPMYEFISEEVDFVYHTRITVNQCFVYERTTRSLQCVQCFTKSTLVGAARLQDLICLTLFCHYYTSLFSILLNYLRCAFSTTEKINVGQGQENLLKLGNFYLILYVCICAFCLLLLCPVSLCFAQTVTPDSTLQRLKLVFSPKNTLPSMLHYSITFSRTCAPQGQG